jgi:release factor glutamine methyltransferase
LSRAWCGGKKGWEVTERFIREVGCFLKPRGRVLLVQSSLGGIEETVRRLQAVGFSVRTVEEKRFFFETLVCLEARLISQS